MAILLNYDKSSDKLSRSCFPNINQTTLFESYEDKGYDKNRPSVTVDNSGFTFTIATNFGYGKKSFLGFRAEYKGNTLFSYKNKNGEYGVNAPSMLFEVEPNSEPGNWVMLFDLLIEVYNNRDNWNINQCLKWQEARLQNPLLKYPRSLAQSFSGYMKMLNEALIGNCSPIEANTLSIIERELPVFAQKLPSSKTNFEKLYEDLKNAIDITYEYMTTQGLLKEFIKIVQFNEINM